MNYYEGLVDGLDVVASQGSQVSCSAFVNNKECEPLYIQVQTKEHRLQTALELASSKNVQVEVTYDDVDGINELRRVRLLDR